MCRVSVIVPHRSIVVTVQVIEIANRVVVVHAVDAATAADRVGHVVVVDQEVIVVVVAPVEDRCRTHGTHRRRRRLRGLRLLQQLFRRL